ncbi:MAG: Deoxycytidine triphosphate deaminase [Candidatus Daviesbacteria bacterium GW2011_GWA1_38_7]|nr:MAG: Deoxycytidine triphosphate deaminase [Candidatus Daviesbacteria bacterium GW2011_GWA1_38_7]
MILSDKKILEEIEKGTIVIKPFDVKNMGGNESGKIVLLLVR